VLLNLNIHSPVYEDCKYGPTPYLEAVGVWDQAGENLSVFAVNRDLESALPVEADASAFTGYCLVEHITLVYPDLKACNLADKVKNE
jgi:alpha-L-arabinofuranosidase